MRSYAEQVTPGPGRALQATLVAGTAIALVLGLGLPAAAAQSDVGAFRITGTLERFHVDDFTAPPATDDELAFVRTESGSVQVPASSVRAVADGSTVDVDLATARVDGTQDPESGTPVRAVTVVAAPDTSLTATGTGRVRASAAVTAGAVKHAVTVVVATPSGGVASSVSAADIAALVRTQVNSYWMTVTNGAVGFTATAYPSVVATSTTPCSAGGVASSDAFWKEVAARVGFTAGAGKHLLVYFRALPACGGIAGLGSVGNGIASGGVVWSNGYNTTGVLGHELGHNLGLGHSQLLDCSVEGVRVMDAPESNCARRSYADSNDIMAISWQNQGFLNASHLRQLGILTASTDARRTDNGAVTLSPLAARTGVRALTLTAGSDSYVVEYRRPVGLDAWMASAQIAGWGTLGVSIRREFHASANFMARESFLLDGDPSTADPDFGNLDTAVKPGTWVNLAGGQLAIRVVSQSSSGAVVQYRNGPASADPRYVPVPQPTVGIPVPRLVPGALRAYASGPVVPVRWTWRVTTPSSNPAAAASVTAASTTRTAGASTTGWTSVLYRAVAVASDGLVVTALGRGSTHYLGESDRSAFTYSYGWAAAARAGTVGNWARVTYRRGTSVVGVVTARSCGLSLVTGPNQGWVGIYVDGHRAAVVNLRSSHQGARLAWATTYVASGRHVVKVVNLSGGVHGQVGFDGLVSLV
jgi:hypothetical protein